MRRGSLWRFQSDLVDLLTECTVTLEDDGHWFLAVWQDDFLTLCEQCETRDAAVRLSNQIWAHFLEQGWTELAGGS